MNAVFFRLTTIHRRVDEEIRRELRRHIPNTIRLLRLQRLRLFVKRRLARHLLRPQRA